MLWGILAGAALITPLFYITGKCSAWFLLLIFPLCCVYLLLCWALPCVVYSFFVDLNKPCTRPSKFFRFYANSAISLIREVFGIKVCVSGFESIPKERFLLVGNHRSQMDPIIELGLFGRFNVGFISKQEMFKIPIINKIIHKCFCLPLDRGNSRNGKNTIVQAAETIRRQTASIGIYPEGTCNIKEKLLKFRMGAFQIAKKAECPIVVAVIRDSELVAKRAPFRRTKVFVDVVGVIGADEVQRSKTVQLGERIRCMMENRLEVR